VCDGSVVQVVRFPATAVAVMVVSPAVDGLSVKITVLRDRVADGRLCLEGKFLKS
jgi:hypothetical protein